MHRRVVFKSSIPWPAQLIIPGDSNPPGGISSGDFVRTTAASLSDVGVVGCLRRLFVQDTVRGVVQGATSTVGITVIRDETFNMRGLDDGVRRTKKYWNGLEGEPTMQYNILPSGGFDFSLANAPASQHVYMADIYSYGLVGLDSSLPDPKTQSEGAQSGPAPAASALPPKKRVKSDDSVMSGTSTESFGTAGLRASLPDPMRGNSEMGSASVTTVMKLYFRQT